MNQKQRLMGWLAAVSLTALMLVFTGCGGGGTTPPVPPANPTNATVTAGDGQVTVSWSAVTGATSYNIYWSTTTGVTTANGTKITNAVNPYVQSSLSNGTAYYYVVTAVNSVGESAASAQVTATPSTGGTTNPFITALTNGIGLREFIPGVTGIAGGASAVPPMGTIDTATPNGNGSYTPSVSWLALAAGAWSPASAPVSPFSVVSLSPAGAWLPTTTLSTLTANANGTLTITSVAFGTMTATPVAVNLAGATLNGGTTMTLPSSPYISAASSVVSVGKAPAIDSSGNSVAPASSVIAATAAYPAGSTEWVLTGEVSGQDSYNVAEAPVMQMVTPAGPLATITLAGASSYTSANPLCTGSPVAFFEFVYSATQPGTANTARFDVYSGAGTACGAITASNVLEGTVDFFYTTVRTQPVVQLTNFIAATGFTINPFSVTLAPGLSGTSFIAAPGNGSVYYGISLPMGYPLDLAAATSGAAYGPMNTTGMNAIMTAAGLPTF